MSQDEHRIGHDGVRLDGVSTYPIDAHDRQLLDAARQQIAQQQMPVLLRPSDPNDRLFVAAFDGTGNDGRRDQAHRTNVASVAIETSMAAEGRSELHVGYVPGPGTQSNPVTRVIDSATGCSYDARLEEMYLKFIHQARDWLKQNPSARISIADIGFSRGAEQAAGFARLVHERGPAEALACCNARLRGAADSAMHASQCCEAASRRLHAEQRRLRWTGWIALLVGSLLAAGGSGWLAHEHLRQLEQARFGEDVLAATRRGAITRCGGELCVRLGARPKHFRQNAEYVLLER